MEGTAENVQAPEPKRGPTYEIKRRTRVATSYGVVVLQPTKSGTFTPRSDKEHEAVRQLGAKRKE